ncbi:hypothetical protein PDE_07614 [Penicillium oxalicum 114-2]|uniref:Uncharacterized protein n=1 Tax=Penicillium oxalicum (strain 114-2 / CGMCC 5302) TaxID=933388 RepID=S7ZQG2_PENO1|nr:hypothetical protein PDE_07614 [Penicillium oxalicum 114-2]
MDRWKLTEACVWETNRTVLLRQSWDLMSNPCDPGIIHEYIVEYGRRTTLVGSQSDTTKLTHPSRNCFLVDIAWVSLIDHTAQSGGSRYTTVRVVDRSREHYRW